MALLEDNHHPLEHLKAIKEENVPAEEIPQLAQGTVHPKNSNDPSSSSSYAVSLTRSPMNKIMGILNQSGKPPTEPD